MDGPKYSRRAALGAAAGFLLLPPGGIALADTGSARPQALERRLREMESAWTRMEAERRQMEADMQALRAEVGRLKAETRTEVQAAEQKLSARQAADRQALESRDKEKNHMVFFRGGYPDMVNTRSNQAYTDLYAKDNGNALGIQNKERDGVYVGAGVDVGISDNLFGLLDATDVQVEFQFDWKRWDSHQGGWDATGQNGAAVFASQTASRLGLNPDGRRLRGVTLSQWTVSASPKIKFLRGNSFRPWLIPAGLSFNILSPPSDSTTFVGPGVMFGAGFDYNLWENLYLGMDGRYDWVANEMNGPKVSYYQIGGYVGWGF